MKFNFPGLSDKAVAESRETYGANVVTTQAVSYTHLRAHET